MIEYLILSILFASAAFLSRSRRAVDIAAGCFFGVQVVLAALLVSDARGSVGDLGIFAFDTLGILFHLLMVLTLGFVMLHSRRYLHEDTLSAYRTYFALLMMLSTAITCVYYADNAAVTWIFLEATTICSAGIIYYRHDQHALEATWKYIFICSTGIAMAYLGILLLCTVVRDGSLDYSSLAATISGGNPLYLKVAFLLIVAGYSCKMEIFPLYTVGVDANFAAPATASAFISTALVNAGFVAIMRIYLLYARCEGEVFDWARHVLILIGIVTLAVGAMFLRRTNNYKRFLSYSTIENMGIVAIGMGVGGAALWAAVFHVACHTLVKSSLFLQLGVVRQIYDSYRINRLGDYININRVGAVGIPPFAAVHLGDRRVPRDRRRRALVAHRGHARAAVHGHLCRMVACAAPELSSQSGRASSVACRPPSLLFGHDSAFGRYRAGPVAARGSEPRNRYDHNTVSYAVPYNTQHRICGCTQRYTDGRLYRPL